MAIGWRKRSEIEIDLADIMKRKGIRLLTQGAQRVHPPRTASSSSDGTSIDYDYLVVATGPELAFDEIPGLGPQGHTQSICHVDHAAHAKEAFEKLAANPGPGRDRRGAGRLLLRTGLRVRCSSWIPSCAAASCATACR